LPAGLVACDLFDLNALNTATSLTWTVADRTANDSCTITANNGNAVAISLVPTQGQNDQVLPGAKSACDANTFQDQQVIDGGYVCTVSGVASAGALFKADNVFVAISAKTFNGASTADVQAALLDVLRSFVAPNSTPTYSS
jgi:hypothetical protein